MFKELHFDEKDEKNLQDPLRKEEKRKVGLEIVEELSERLKEYEKEEIETLKDAIHRLSTREPKGMLKDTIRRSTKPSKFEEHDQEQAAGLEMQEQERRAYQDSPKGDHGARLGGHGRGRGRGHGVYDNDDDVGGEEHKDEAGFYGVAERHAPTMPVSYNPQHQHHHQQQQQQQPNGNPAAFDAKVVASNLRRLSVLLQRGGMAGVGGAEAVSMGETGTQAPQRHPMATVLSGMTPPAPADTGRRQSVRK